MPESESDLRTAVDHSALLSSSPGISSILYRLLGDTAYFLMVAPGAVGLPVQPLNYAHVFTHILWVPESVGDPLPMSMSMPEPIPESTTNPENKLW